MDQTAWFWDTAVQRAKLQGLPQERLTKLKSAQILRSLAGKSVFQAAAVEVARNINALRDFVKERQRDYVQPGRCSSAERDKIEEQVGLYVRSCTANIQKLEASIGRSEDLSPHCNAHRHGVVALILSERLQGISKAFDQCRSIRYQQLMAQQKQQHQRQREVMRAKEQNAAALHSSHDAWSSQQAADPGPGVSQAQAQIVAENRALQEELQSLGQQVASTEASMRELATLTQMFSTQVLHQSEQTRQLYHQAVEATEFIQKGNVQLQKAIRLNSSTRFYIFCFLLLASLLLLFFDWWSS